MNFSVCYRTLSRFLMTTLLVFSWGCDDDPAGGNLPEASEGNAGTLAEDESRRDESADEDAVQRCYFDRQCDDGFVCDTGGESQPGVCVPSEAEETGGVEVQDEAEAVTDQGAEGGSDEIPEGDESDNGGTGANDGAGGLENGNGLAGEPTEGSAGMALTTEDDLDNPVSEDSAGNDQSGNDEPSEAGQDAQSNGTDSEETSEQENTTGGNAEVDDTGNDPDRDQNSQNNADTDDDDASPRDPAPERIDGAIGEYRLRGQVHLFHHLRARNDGPTLIELGGQTQARDFGQILNLPQDSDPDDVWPEAAWVTDPAPPQANCLIERRRDSGVGALNDRNIGLGDAVSVANSGGVTLIPYRLRDSQTANVCMLDNDPDTSGGHQGVYSVGTCTAPNYLFWDGAGEDITITAPGSNLFGGAFRHEIRSPTDMLNVVMDIDQTDGSVSLSDGTNITWTPGNGNWVQVTLRATGEGRGNDRIRCMVSDAGGLLSLEGTTLETLGAGPVEIEISRVVFSEFLADGPPSLGNYAFELELESKCHPNDSRDGAFTLR